MIALWLSLTSAHAAVKAPMFSDGLVLQQQMAAPVFGTAAPGEEVSVVFRGKTKSAKADASGKWQVKAEAGGAGGPFELTIKGQNTLTIQNVLVGEVWLCAGQSNMGYAMKKFGPRNIAEAGKANCPKIRICTMQRGQPAKWQAMTPEVCLNSSATAYYFAKNLQAKLNIPIGLIVSSSPGTSIRYWADPASIAEQPSLQGQKSVGKWFNELIAPAIPYGLRGVIWYQGESDADRSGAPVYKQRFFSLIKNYRKAWGQGEIPFIYMQIASFGTTQTTPTLSSNFAIVRDAQTAALALPKTALATAIDIGDKDWHPWDKWDVGRRLALPALWLVYEMKSLKDYSGPLLDGAEEKAGQVVVKFSHASGGLEVHGSQATPQAVPGFAVCGADGKWFWANGSVKGSSIELTCREVKKPVRVRYAWADCPPATPLYNQAGLPAIPFDAALPATAIERNAWFKSGEAAQ